MLTAGTAAKFLSHKMRRPSSVRNSSTCCIYFDPDPISAASTGQRLIPGWFAALAPRVMATEMEPGPTVSGSVSGNCFIDLFASNRLLNLGGAICFCSDTSDSYTRCFAGAVRLKIQSYGYADYREAGSRMTHLLISMAKTSGGFGNTYLAQNLTRL